MGFDVVIYQVSLRLIQDLNLRHSDVGGRGGWRSTDAQTAW
jgi:hypothetical protein